jgi:hypothetical protein
MFRWSIKNPRNYFQGWNKGGDDQNIMSSGQQIENYGKSG